MSQTKKIMNLKDKFYIKIELENGNKRNQVEEDFLIL